VPAKETLTPENIIHPFITMPNRRDFLTSAAAIGGATAMGAPALAAAEQLASGGAVPLAPPDRQPPNLPLPEVPGRRVGWAIVGLGELALGEIMPAFPKAKHSQPVALVSGHPDKAKRVAEAYAIPNDSIYNYDNFDKLAEDKSVEVVYIVLPNSMHAEFTMRALRAGKHVLCEKPMAVSVEECTKMIEAAKEADRLLGVAYRLHSEPMNRKVMEMCAKKQFGVIKTFESSNCQDVKAPNIRLSADLGGGPVGDVGVYSINAARYCTGEEPVEVTAIAHQPKDDPRFREVPESVAFTLRFPSGILAHCDCSFGSAESRRYRVHCAKGWIEMDPAFSYRGLRLRTKGGDPKKGTAEATEHLVEAVNHFTEEMDHFSDCVLHGTKLRTPGEMGLADMRVMTAIYEAIRTGKAVPVQA
jgi:predicted dehydrogenase